MKINKIIFYLELFGRLINTASRALLIFITTGCRNDDLKYTMYNASELHVHANGCHKLAETKVNYRQCNKSMPNEPTQKDIQILDRLFQYFFFQLNSTCFAIYYEISLILSAISTFH